jgi:cytochrome subunit of sulfide dehydrogenase
MNRMHVLAVVSVIGGAAVAFGQSGSTPHPGRLLASNCFQCHGTNGNALGDMRRLADRDAEDIYEDLLDMRAGAANRNIMHLQARSYTDEQLRLIADYFSRQPH